MTWDAYNRRKTTLREALTIVDRRRDLTTTDLLDRVDPRREAFEDEDAFLLELQMTWFQRLSGQLDRSAGETGSTPERTAITTWIDTAAQLPGARAVLDDNLDAPALAKGLTNERIMMAAVSGVPMHHPDAADHGRRIIDVARDQAVYPIIDGDVVLTDESPTSLRFSGFVSRLKSALAA